MVACPDCQGSLKLIPDAKGVYWCSPCKRARDGVHMDRFVSPLTIKAKFKRLPDEKLSDVETAS